MYRFGIIGYGNIGRRHARHINANPNAELVAICDINPATHSPEGLEAHTKFTTDFEAFISENEMDVVNICVPNYLHESLTIKSLEAGVNVLVEKPMALSVSECDNMIAAAERSGKKLIEVKQNRYNPPVKAVRDLIQNGSLGQLFQIQVNCFWNRNQEYYESEWRGDKTKDGGAIFTQFSHFVDIVYHLFGKVRPVSGFIKNLNHPYIGIEDSGSVLMENEDGAIITFSFSNNAYKKNMEGSITILAEHGTIKIGGEYLNTLETSLQEGLEVAQEHIHGLPNDYGSYKGSMSNHDQTIQNVIDVLDGKAEPTSNAHDGKEVVRIMEEMYKVSNA